MSSRIDLAKQLLKDREFYIAKEVLEKEPNDSQALYLLSLLHRYDDEYDQEKTVVDKALEIDGSNTYMRQRLAWHNLPIFDRVVPRQPLHLPRDPKTIPSVEVLENLCFVTGADSKYFQLMVDCIESLRVTQLYKNIPICVLDCGLTEGEKHLLQTTFNIQHIQVPDWDTAVPASTHPGYKAMTARPFLSKYFPEFTYHIWLDADAWVQDERAFDELLALAEEQGIGWTPDLACQRFGRLYNWNFLQPQYRNAAFQDSKTVCSGLLVLKKDSAPVKEWQRYMKEHGNDVHFYHMIDQLTLNLVYLNTQFNKTAEYQKTHYFPHSSIGCPHIDKEKRIYNFDKQIVGVVALADYHRKPASYRRPFMDLSVDCSPENLCAIESYFHNEQLLMLEGVRLDSFFYKVLPWADKGEIWEKIVKCCGVTG